MEYKVTILHRNQDTLLCHSGVEVIPLKDKLFHDDTFVFNEDRNPLVVSSPVRVQPTIAGVLVLEGNKTYGRDKKTKKLLYKCVPDDVRLPAFLVPYEMKHIGFSKVFTNHYVTIRYDHWDDKHPRAKLESVIGSVDTPECFYEYQLWCKGLQCSLQKFQKEAIKALDKVPTPAFEDRTHLHAITIDPLHTLDFDDAFSVDRDAHTVSIYVSNVAWWLDAMQLWPVLSRRVATMYLPDKKRPMLPTILSENRCSLQQDETRVALAMDMLLDHQGKLVEVRFANVLIRVARNYVYEEPALLHDETYLGAREMLFKHHEDSHEFVSHLMVTMNQQCAKRLAEHKVGIFRSATTLSEEIKVASYTIDAGDYVHMTSPIRRLVDVLNMIPFQSVMGLATFSKEAMVFYERWLRELDFINTNMRTIRRVQNDCSLLDLCHRSESLLQKEYIGYLFDKIERNDGLFEYSVFLPDLKHTAHVILADQIDEASATRTCKLVLFQDEERLKRKVRVQVIS